MSRYVPEFIIALIVCAMVAAGCVVTSIEGLKSQALDEAVETVEALDLEATLSTSNYGELIDTTEHVAAFESWTWETDSGVFADGDAIKVAKRGSVIFTLHDLEDCEGHAGDQEKCE